MVCSLHPYDFQAVILWFGGCKPMVWKALTYGLEGTNLCFVGHKPMG